MGRFHLVLAVSLLALICASTALLAAKGAPVDAAALVRETGVQGGVIVHLGCGDGSLTADLRINDRYIVHGLDANPANVRKARETIRARGVYGDVSVARLTGRRLPYAENLVNLVVTQKLGSVPMSEVMRVLAPGGVATIKRGGEWQKTTKEWPAEIDEWTHHLHGADGNPVANDTVVGPPKHYQWLAGPLWFRSHDSDSSISAVVTAKGRIFYIVDEGPTSTMGDHELPDKWSLAARDAFNGTMLWKTPIEQWGWREWKDTYFTDRPDNLPVNLPKRLVAVGDHVYVTLGYHAPVSQLDAATGEVRQTYGGTEDTREIILHDGALLLSVLRDGRLKVMSVDADSGQTKWETEPTLKGTSEEYFPQWRRRGDESGPMIDPALNPATDGKIICFIDGRDVVGLDFATGDERWRTEVEDSKPATSPGTMILHEDVVLHAKRNAMMGLSATTGEPLWSTPKREIGWLWFQWKDVFVIDGLVWTWSTEFGTRELTTGPKPEKSQWPMYLEAFDPRTGELKEQIPMGNIFTAPHHHRCYRNMATVKYVIASRRGSEFIDLETGKHEVHNWVRGTCHLGMMPANGLQYAPPHPCMCYSAEKLNGFNALAPAAETAADAPDPGPRLERGRAFGKIADTLPASESDWPTYRHDARRTGHAAGAVTHDLSERWATGLDGKITAPTAVGDRVYVAEVDAHHVIALDADDGAKVWEFAAGGRVDTPPTYHEGTLLFGSADGHVSCVRATDGALVWRFRAAPDERLIGAFGQLESAWPVHGSILVQDGLAYFAAGRSSHLDGGIGLYAVDAATGELKHEAQLAGPEQTVDNMEDNATPPQGALTDILQSDGDGIVMRNLAFDAELNPRPAADIVIQSPAGLLDDTYFKRAPWRFGRGANWGRLLVHDDKAVHLIRMWDSLACIVPENFFTPGGQGYLLAAQPRAQHSQIAVATTPSLNPQDKAITVEAFVKAEGVTGAILARGGTNHGYALALRNGKPEFTVRVTDVPYTVRSAEAIGADWTHVAGVLTLERELRVYIDGDVVATGEADSLMVGSPGQPTEVGADACTASGEYESPFAFTGTIDEVRLYHRALTEDELLDRVENPGKAPTDDAELALNFTFDDGTAMDTSGNDNHGRPQAVTPAEGISGKALRFAGSNTESWNVRIPIRGRALVATDERVFVAGPPDVIDPVDPLGAFEGRLGGMLWVFSSDKGEKLAEHELDSPPVFDGMAAAGERLYVSTRAGEVICLESG